VSIVVPFAGGAAEAADVTRALGTLQLGAHDEAIVVDNSPGASRHVAGTAAAGPLAGTAAGGSLAGAPAGGPLAGVPARVVRADAVRSSYHARNRGAAVATGEWLLFFDADCRPRPDLIGEYLGRERSQRCGAVAGPVLPEPGRDRILARYARSRGYLDQRTFMDSPGRPYAATANLLVRRTAWAEVGGFSEVRSGGDIDFCWRLQDAGWTLELCESAWVEHRHRERLAPLLRQRARYAAGHRWLERRYPSARRPPSLARALARAGWELAAAVPRGDTEDLRFRALDVLALLAYAAGRLASNEPRPGRRARLAREARPGRRPRPARGR
jgi:GT2 family glycosyltransferase